MKPKILISSYILFFSSATKCVPMIPLGLKETKEVEFAQSFKVCIKKTLCI